MKKRMNGYLTYTMAVFAIVGAASAYLLNLIDMQTAVALVWGGLSIFGLRRAIASNGSGQ
jgi:hypothetical protein